MKFNKLFDHTNLKPDAKKEDIVKLCNEAKKYDFASVCVNPGFIPLASECLKGSDVKVCTVIGFPLGANSTETKVFEAVDAKKAGAEEVDMVINISRAKDHDYLYIKEEIAAIKKAIGDTLLKVIIETCLLTDEEKVEVCKVAKEAKADYVKTSTGFSKAGANPRDIALMRKTVGSELGVKASGGVHYLSEVNDLVAAGASRIGASASVAIMEEYVK
ncbi:MAG: deoxyribose-phosphate aldolase [Bacilli bacterium]|nr:deoxyribose-phosphate aldolase [Bacilli bacterium]MDY6430690.1 deoxyribose-phosphate aldolase [Bacilli bacterium]